MPIRICTRTLRRNKHCWVRPGKWLINSVQQMWFRVRFQAFCLSIVALGCCAASVEPRLPSSMVELVHMLTDNIAEEVTVYRDTHDPEHFYRSNFTTVAKRLPTMQNPCFTYEGVRECYPAFFLTGVPKGASGHLRAQVPSTSATSFTRNVCFG